MLRQQERETAAATETNYHSKHQAKRKSHGFRISL